MVRNSYLFLALVAALVLGCHATTETHELPAGANASCPVSGKPVDPAVYYEHEGTKIYLCCEHCIETVAEDPATYMAKAHPE